MKLDVNHPWHFSLSFLAFLLLLDIYSYLFIFISFTLILFTLRPDGKIGEVVIQLVGADRDQPQGMEEGDMAR